MDYIPAVLRKQLELAYERVNGKPIETEEQMQEIYEEVLKFATPTTAPEEAIYRYLESKK